MDERRIKEVHKKESDSRATIVKFSLIFFAVARDSGELLALG